MHFLFFISLLFFHNDWLAVLLSFNLHALSILHSSHVKIEVEFAQKLSFLLLSLAFSVLSLLFGLCLILSLLLWVINARSQL